jgi:AraC-like DNA-binding protein
MRKRVDGMELDNISPYIRVAMDGYINSYWHMQERVIFDYELLYIKEGEVFITIEDIIYKGCPGDIFLFKPGQRHSIRFEGGNCFRQPHIHFDLFYRQDSPDVKVSFKPLEQMSDIEIKWFREDITNDPNINRPNKICLKNTKLFEEMLFQIIKEFEMKLPYYEINVKGLFINLWTFLLRENHLNCNPDVFSSMKGLLKIKEYLDFHDKVELSLSELASEFKISKYHLTRLFKKAFAVTPIHYHRQARIQKVKVLIQFTELSLTEIAETHGFSSLHVFSRAFRDIEGVAPSFYRRRS